MLSKTQAQPIEPDRLSLRLDSNTLPVRVVYPAVVEGNYPPTCQAMSTYLSSLTSLQVTLFPAQLCHGLVIQLGTQLGGMLAASGTCAPAASMTGTATAAPLPLPTLP